MKIPSVTSITEGKAIRRPRRGRPPHLYRTRGCCIVKRACIITDDPDARSAALPGNPPFEIRTVFNKEFDDFRMRYR